MARHTIRGVVAANQTKRLIMDDGIFTKGHRITGVHIIGVNNGDIEGIGILSYSDAAITLIDFDDSNQFGWAFWDGDTTNGSRMHMVLDPEHVVLQDLFIHSVRGAFNYIVTLEPVSLTEPQGVLQLVKHRRQG